MVSNPKTSKTLKPPTKQARMKSNFINNGLSVNNNHSNPVLQQPDVIVLSSDSSEDDRDVLVIEGSKTQARQLKQMDVIALCPLSRPGNPCKECKVEKRLGGKKFSCHCGANTIWLSKGRVRSAEAHWSTGMSEFHFTYQYHDLNTNCWIFLDRDLYR